MGLIVAVVGAASTALIINLILEPSLTAFIIAMILGALWGVIGAHIDNA